MIALLVILCVLGLFCVGLLAFILLTLQSQIDRHTRFEASPAAPWPIIPESVRVDKVPAVQRKPRKPRAPKPAPALEPERDTATLPLLSGDDAQKPTV
jgi:hypothetical protein